MQKNKSESLWRRLLGRRKGTKTTKRKTGATAPKGKAWVRRVIIAMWCLFLAPLLGLALMLTLTATGVFGRMPSFEELENPKSNLASEIYADDGSVIGSFFVENRSHVQYDDLFPRDEMGEVDYAQCLSISGRRVPPLAAALIATEDERFYSHSGIDFRSLARVGVKTIAMQHSSQGGGSTVTQQLAKNLFPRGNARGEGKLKRMTKLLTSKFKEWITAIKLEYNYTKEEILTMYLNTVEYGSNSYGIKSAAATFFNKLPSELNLQEAALLVGIVNAPSRYSPVRNYDEALKRRNLVLQRIQKTGAISQHICDSISALPIHLNYQPISHNSGSATYFREMLRRTMTAERPQRRNFYTEWDYNQACKEYDENPLIGWCHKNLKPDGTEYDIYRDGLKIYTTLNAPMQLYAEAALQAHMSKVVQPMMDKQVGKGKMPFVDLNKQEIEKIIQKAMRESVRYQTMRAAGKDSKDIDAAFRKKCKMKVFTYKGIRDTVMTPRDSILHHKRIMRAGFVAMDPHTGYVKAYVGGPNFQFFKYDMAKQGKRQIGSTVKPFIYTFAINHLGLSPCTMVPNQPVTIETARGVAWSPKESGDGKYEGVYPLRWGLAKSRNNYSAWIMKQAKQPDAVADLLHTMGINSFIDPVYSLCLGSFESNPYELVAAYSTFANEGVYNAPIFVTRIEDNQGNTISTFTSSAHEAISRNSAYTMLQMLKYVITEGTGRRMTWAFDFYKKDMDIAGKTGTTNENRDAWFMCVTPKLVAGAWVGGEDQATHIKDKGEGSKLALPIVGEVLSRVYKDDRLAIKPTDRFVRPEGWEEFDCSQAEAQNRGKAHTADEFFD